MKTVVTMLFLLSSAPLLARGADIYVSPNGDDGNPGTRAKPVKSIEKARTLARLKISGGLKEDLFIRLGDGTYPLKSRLTFSAEDCNPPHRVTWIASDGETAVISGGRRVTGWTRSGDMWKTTIPEVKAGKWFFRNLYVNGRRAQRARYPDVSRTDRRWMIECESGTAGKPDSKYRLTLKEPDEFADKARHWQNFKNVEVNVVRVWAGNKKYIADFNPSNRTFIFEGPHSQSSHYVVKSNPKFCYFENSKDFLSVPGEFFLDPETGTCYYMPRPGETTATARVFAPVLDDTLLTIHGVENLHFFNMTFAHSDYKIPRPSRGDKYSGYSEVQGALEFNQYKKFTLLPSAIDCRQLKNSSFVKCRILHMGGSGFSLREECDNNLIHGCEIADIGGNGISLGIFSPSTGVTLSNNAIHHVGRDFISSHAIMCSNGYDHVFSHNALYGMPYGAISIGWWGGKFKNAEIAYNDIFDYCRYVEDTGGIYSLGNLGRTLLKGNHIHHAFWPYGRKAAGGVRGIFFDQQSTGLVLDANIGYALPVAYGFNQSTPEKHTWKAGKDPKFGNNIFINKWGRENANRTQKPNADQLDTDAFRMAGLEPQWQWRVHQAIEPGEPETWKSVMEDRFEKGLDGWRASGSAKTEEGIRLNGKGARLELARKIGLGSQTHVRLRFRYKPVGFSDDDSLRVFFNNGKDWFQAATFRPDLEFIDGETSTGDIILKDSRFSPGPMPETGTFRFETHAGAGDSLLLEHVEISTMKFIPAEEPATNKPRRRKSKDKPKE